MGQREKYSGSHGTTGAVRALFYPGMFTNINSEQFHTLKE